MEISDELTEAIESYIAEKYGEKIESLGFEVDDLACVVMEQIEEHLRELELMIEEGLEAELDS